MTPALKPPPRVLAEYLRLREQGTPARSALQHAKADEPPPWDWRDDGTRATREEPAGWKLHLRVEPDELADDFRGTFSDNWTSSSVNAQRCDPEHADRRRYLWFLPATPVAEHRRELSKLGYARHTADVMARGYVLDDLRHAQDAQHVLIVTAHLDGVELGRAVVGGYEASETWQETRAYFEQEAADLADEAMAEARNTLRRLATRARGAGIIEP